MFYWTENRSFRYCNTIDACLFDIWQYIKVYSKGILTKPVTIYLEDSNTPVGMLTGYDNATYYDMKTLYRKINQKTKLDLILED